ncbi:enoyl-CoA hydratase/isomerase family protein [Hydrogenophaga sp. BPS33]|uniref:enoyl-CoA hydratase/isomerase family protein n=1 Tax=Hydrogenophaga sp. BPS33 TaxID=2651974 RepID=UPI00131F6C4B|nr:enoyl-CoA hydratase-related protein [Hydrogenophaga sp. BPS33]QHE86806.1 enoyl-CoA hydratase [Hydrogenophaga sp. BPS33]
MGSSAYGGREGAVATITFNRPQALNAIDVTMAQGFLAAVREIAADRGVRAVLLRGEGKGFVAAGAGLSLMLQADFVIAAEGTRFNLAYVNIGTSCDVGASWALPRRVGLRRALEIALLGDTVDAVSAEQMGLVNRVVPADALPAEAMALAQRLAAGTTVALGQLRRLMRSSLDHDLATQLDREAQGFQVCAASADFGIGVDAFFARAKPAFTGR